MQMGPAEVRVVDPQRRPQREEVRAAERQERDHDHLGAPAGDRRRDEQEDQGDAEVGTVLGTVLGEVPGDLGSARRCDELTRGGDDGTEEISLEALRDDERVVHRAELRIPDGIDERDDGERRGDAHRRSARRACAPHMWKLKSITKTATITARTTVVARISLETKYCAIEEQAEDEPEQAWGIALPNEDLVEDDEDEGHQRHEHRVEVGVALGDDVRREFRRAVPPAKAAGRHDVQCRTKQYPPTQQARTRTRSGS